MGLFEYFVDRIEMDYEDLGNLDIRGLCVLATFGRLSRSSYSVVVKSSRFLILHYHSRFMIFIFYW